MLSKKETNQQILNAQQMAYKAVDVFKKTLTDLEKSNGILSNVITKEQEQIKEHKENICTAEDSMIANQLVIDKLKDFVHIS